MANDKRRPVAERAVQLAAAALYMRGGSEKLVPFAQLAPAMRRQWEEQARPLLEELERAGVIDALREAPAGAPDWTELDGARGAA